MAPRSRPIGQTSRSSSICPTDGVRWVGKSVAAGRPRSPTLSSSLEDGQTLYGVRGCFRYGQSRSEPVRGTSAYRRSFACLALKPSRDSAITRRAGSEQQEKKAR